MADRYYENAIAQPLDRFVTLTIQHNIQRIGGQAAYDVATRQTWARRDRVAASAQLQVLAEGSELSNVSRWLIRNEAYITDPALVEGVSWLTDDDGNNWRLLGIQPVGRRQFMELYMVFTDSELPVTTPPA